MCTLMLSQESDVTDYARTLEGVTLYKRTVLYDCSDPQCACVIENSAGFALANCRHILYRDNIVAHSHETCEGGLILFVCRHERIIVV